MAVVESNTKRFEDALYNYDYAELDNLFAAGVDVNSLIFEGWYSAICFVVAHSKGRKNKDPAKLIKYLLDHKADPNLIADISIDMETAVFNSETGKLGEKRDPRIYNFKMPPLFIAVTNFSIHTYDMVKVLLDGGANVNATVHRGIYDENILMFMQNIKHKTSKYYQVVDLLLVAGFNGRVSGYNNQFLKILIKKQDTIKKLSAHYKKQDILLKLQNLREE